MSLGGLPMNVHFLPSCLCPVREKFSTPAASPSETRFRVSELRTGQTGSLTHETQIFHMDWGPLEFEKTMNAPNAGGLGIRRGC